MSDTRAIIDQALAHHRSGDGDGALRLVADARRIHFGDPELLRLHAWLHWQNGSLADALALYDKATRLLPTGLLVWRHFGSVLAEAKRFVEALAAFDQALAIDPSDADAWLGRAGVLIKMDNFEAALESFARGLALRPTDSAALHEYGLTLQVSGQFAEALDTFERALTLDPDNLDIARDRGGVLYELGRTRESLNALEALLQRSQARDALMCARAHYALALVHLAEGNLETAFQHYEYRFAAGATEAGVLLQRQWQGERLDRNLLIWREQGVGEDMAFARFLPMAIERTPNVLLWCDDRLKPIMRRSFPKLQIFNTNTNAAEAEAQCSLVSLPFAMALKGSNLRPRSAYLKDDAPRTAEMHRLYRERADGRPLVGISWRSTGRNLGVQKSTNLMDWSALLALPCLFVNLQYGDTVEEVTAASAAFGCEIVSDATVDQLRDMDAFLSQVMAVDGIVSVSNTTVHAAGALGQRCLVLEPARRGVIWFWGTQGEQARWYESVHAIRYIPGEGWPARIARAANALKRQLKDAR